MYKRQDITQNQELDDLVTQQTLDIAEQTLVAQLTELFYQNGYKIDEIQIHISSTEDEQAIGVTLWADQTQRQNQIAIERLVTEQLGVAPQWVFTG